MDVNLMSVATATRVELYSLPASAIGSSTDYVWTKNMNRASIKSCLGIGNETYLDDHYTNYPGSSLWEIRSVWNEAHIENNYRDALVEDEFRVWPTRVNPLVPVELDRSAQANALMAMRKREAELTRQVTEFQSLNANQSATIQRLMEEQVKGNDPRMSEFWAAAHDVAEEAGHCADFDNMADQLDGPRRKVTYRVVLERTVSYTETCTVEVEIDRSHNVETSDLKEAAQAIDENGGLDWSNEDGDYDYSGETITDYDRI
jgi:hypothetical protein